MGAGVSKAKDGKMDAAEMALSIVQSILGRVEVFDDGTWEVAASGELPDDAGVQFEAVQDRLVALGLVLEALDVFLPGGHSTAACEPEPCERPGAIQCAPRANGFHEKCDYSTCPCHGHVLPARAR